MLLPRRKTFHVNSQPRQFVEPRRAPGQGLLLDGYAPSQMIEDLRKYQSELEIQNRALRYSQQEAEGASERFATLFSSVPLALMVVDEEGQVMASNAMAQRLFQPLETDAPLHFLLPFVATSHADEVAVAFLNARNGGTSEVSEVVFIAGSAGNFTGDLHIARIDNPQGDLAHFICAVIDQGPLLTQRHALQESAASLLQRNEDLLQSENRMAAIINSSLEAILCVDEQQRITVFNPAATALFAIAQEEALGAPLGRFLPQIEKALAEGALPAQAALGEVEAHDAQGRPLFVEVSLSVERRQRHLPHSQTPTQLRGARPSQGAITTLFLRDLSARKQAEAQRIALETQLRESQKMQAMGTMAGGIAHDFNNILSAILGNVELARQDTPTDAQSQTSLQEIDKAGRRARDLVRQILTFSRNEVPQRIAIQLAEVVHETARRVKVTLPPAVTLNITLQSEVPNVLADATQVEQALLNLCTNAILAITQGSPKAQGVVSITLAHAPLEQVLRERLGLSAGAYVTLSVRDTGSGIDQATLERIFEPFFTTREVGQGTGLGLSVVHGIMQTHQGAVHVESAPGQGSLFALYFPVTQDPEQAINVVVAPSVEVRGEGKRVMYVDDDQALVFLVKRVLQRKGFAVTTFTDPRDALAALQAAPQGFDLLVTDYNMPGFSGVDLLRAVRAQWPTLPVALASGYVTPEIEKSALEEGANALIYKPNDVTELCETVQRLVTERDAS